MVNAENISFSAGQKIILQPTSVNFTGNKLHVIMGANGAGKSTLLKILAGELRLSDKMGKVYLENKALYNYSRTELAQTRAVLSQHYEIAFPIIVRDLVEMGRFPYHGTEQSEFNSLCIRRAVELMHIEKYLDQDYDTLSGGEAQKVQMTRVLSQIIDATEQKEKLLFLDEPVSHLDIKYQHELLNIALGLCRHHITVIAILHDINLAIQFADEIIFMKQGRIIYQVNDVFQITEEMINEIFEIKCKIISGLFDRPYVIFQ